MRAGQCNRVQVQQTSVRLRTRTQDFIGVKLIELNSNASGVTLLAHGCFRRNCRIADLAAEHWCLEHSLVSFVIWVAVPQIGLRFVI